jgi:hypothetical protein
MKLGLPYHSLLLFEGVLSLCSRWNDCRQGRKPALWVGAENSSEWVGLMPVKLRLAGWARLWRWSEAGDLLS